MTFQDHINKFNELVCQLLNADEKISDQEQALLVLASLPKSYRPIVQTLLIGREKITLEEAITIVKENERMISKMDVEGFEEEDGRGGDERTLAAEESGRGRNKWRRNDPHYRSKSRPREWNDRECYYCHENGHIQRNCSKAKEDLKNLKELQEKLGKVKLDEEGGSSNVGQQEIYSEEIFLTQCNMKEVSQEK